MPVDRRDLLEVLAMQDAIADTAQDIAGLLLERDMEVPAGMEGPLMELVKRCVDSCDLAHGIIRELDELVESVGVLDLELRGLMTVGPTEGGPAAARPGFDAVRAAVDRLGLTVCSMGMSGDLEVAVECGSTEVRVGTALFGSRPVPVWRDQER